MDTLASIYTWKSVSCMRLHRRIGSPAKKLCVVIWQSEQTTSHKRACAWKASSSGGHGLNGNDYYSREEEEVCLFVCLIVFLGIISQWPGCLQAYHPPDVWSLTLKMQELTFITFDDRGRRVYYYESHDVLRSSQLTQLCRLLKSSSIMNLLVFSFGPIKLDLNL